VKLHALVEDLETARRAVADGATVVQLRKKGATTEELVEAGRPFLTLPATIVVDDDVEAAIALGAGVHLGSDDAGADRARDAGILLGLSVDTPDEARAAEAFGAHYVGAGPVWATPTKADTGAPLGLDGLRAVCDAVSIPVVAIGGIDASNAADCIRAGAAGIAVVRAVTQARALREAIDAAL
jgi:thiamine-phosphate pyrophosphorylase